MNVTGGTITRTGSNTVVFSGASVINLQGGDLTTRGFTLKDTTAFTIDSASSSLSVTLDSSGDLRVEDSSTFVINAGTLEVDDEFALVGTGGATFNGGTTTITDGFRFNSGITLGGSTAGSISAGRVISGTQPINWLSGSQMSLTINDRTWETEWNAGRLRYNGLTNSTINGGSGATWADVTTAGGLDGNYSFQLTGNSLSLAYIPEPSSFLLLGLAGLGVIRRRRQRQVDDGASYLEAG
jgi:hypothetical protein